VGFGGDPIEDTERGQRAAVPGSSPPPPAAGEGASCWGHDIGCGCGGNDWAPWFAAVGGPSAKPGSRCGCFAGLSAGNCGWKACAAVEAAAALLVGSHGVECGYVSGGVSGGGGS
ncbi:unnamed protein product, partial [Ectocarpus sp. 12 AP-2014]